MKLYEMADLSLGVLLNREENKYGLRQYKVFNIRNYEENMAYEMFYTEKDFDDKLTKEKDLLFRMVYPNKLVYVGKEQADLLVPSQFCVIRTHREILNSSFLKWYLESKLGKEKIMMEMRGSSVQKISLTSLKNIEIPEIEIEKQENIEDLINLWEKEKETLESLIENKEKLYNSIIEEISMKGEADARTN